MRKLLWFTLGFGAACGFCAYGRLPVLLILPAFALLAGFFFGEKRLPAVILVGLGILGGLIWFCRFETRTLAPVYTLDGITREAVIRCKGFPEETDYGYRAEGTVTIGQKNYTAMCYLDEDSDLVPGDLLSGPFRFKVTAPGGMKESTYYQGEGVFLLAYQEDALAVSSADASWKDIPAKLRQGILTILENLLSADTAPFAKALLTGDGTDLSYAVKTDLTVTGIRHIVAVSGLHVSILFGLLGMMTLRRRFLTALVGFPALFLFAAVAGFTPSVSRACIMCGLLLVAMLLGREYDGPSALSAAGLVLLLVNPLVIASVSYQLSFASVTGIFLFSPGIRKWLKAYIAEPSNNKFLRNLSRWFTLSVSVTLGATVATIPLCAYYFGVVSLVAVLTNLLVLWVISLIFYGLMAMCWLWGLLPALSRLIGYVVSWMIRYVLWIAGWLGSFPLSAVYTRSPYLVAWLVFVYILLAVFLLSRNRKPGTLCCCVTLSFCLALLLSWTEPLMDDVRFTVLDVGQGQCLLLQAEGKTYLVDCGGSSDRSAADAAAQTLLSQGIAKLDAFVLTHYDRDHAGGAQNLLTRIDTDLLVLPPVYSEEKLEAEQILYASEDLLLESGNTKVIIFSSNNPGTDNENSLCVLFDTEKCDILITGDRDGFGERSLLRNAAVSHVDVLVAGHHGSKYATCEELLWVVQPEIVCISAGRNNPFGHPAPELLERLASFGCTVYRTDLQGDILIRR